MPIGIEYSRYLISGGSGAENSGLSRSTIPIKRPRKLRKRARTDGRRKKCLRGSLESGEGFSERRYLGFRGPGRAHKVEGSCVLRPRSQPEACRNSKAPLRLGNGAVRSKLR